MEFHHIPVLLQQVVDGLCIRPDGIYVDGTAGGAGHSLEIARRLTTGQLISIDQDPDAVQTARDRLKGYPAEVVQANYSQIGSVLAARGIEGVDGVLLDLGVSSHQLDTPQRGFSYQSDAPLDMRMSQSGLSAEEVVNTWEVSELTRILREYGEERYAYAIAKGIARARTDAPIRTTLQLADIIRANVPAAVRRDKNPCKRSFQAIRMAVNQELEALSEGLDGAFDSLRDNGRLAVITFHSLEDRMVKQRFASWCRGCECPPDFPVCVCGKKPRAELVMRKPMEASLEELKQNPRSHSAKLRIVRRLP